MRYAILILLLTFASGLLAQDGTRRSDNRVNKMYDVSKKHPKHKRRDMTIELGDSTKTGRRMSGKQFSPSLSFTGWGGEVMFRIQLASEFDSLKTATRENSLYKGRHRLKLRTDKLTHDIRMEDWGAIWDMILPEKPDRNVFRYKFRSKGLTFTYQDTLTDEQVLDGARRPDSVVGSYAIYHSEKSNNTVRWLKGNRDSIVSGEYYGTGKFGHLYRPKAWDSAGDTVWCKIEIVPTSVVGDVTVGWLFLTVPPVFHNGAVYPVTVDPDVGYTTQGGTADGQTANRAHGHSNSPQQHTALASQEIIGLSTWTQLSSAGSETMELSAYRTQTDGPRMGLTTRETSNEQITITNTTAAIVSTSTLSVPMIEDSTYAAAWGEFSTLSGKIELFFDTGSQDRDRQTSSDALGASWNHASYVDSKFSVYFTYGAASGGGGFGQVMRTVIID